MSFFKKKLRKRKNVDPFQLAPPLPFRGKMISISSLREGQEHPVWRTHGPAGTTITSINNHIDSCMVDDICRVDNTGMLVFDRLDNPEFEPWFLLHGEYRGIDRYFIVNGDDHYLPVLSSNDGSLFLRNPAAYKEELTFERGRDNTRTIIYEWDMFSRLDLGLVREAISVYARGEL